MRQISHFTVFLILALMAPPALSEPKMEVPGLKINHWYALANPAELQPIRRIDGESSFNVPRRLRQLSLPAGTQLTVFRYSKTGEFTLIGVDSDLSRVNRGVRSRDPVIVWVRTTDVVAKFATKNVDIQSLQTIFEPGADLTPPPSSEPEPVAAGVYDSETEMSHCLRDVRLTSIRISHTHVPRAAMASKAISKYRAVGWKRIKFSAQSPIGTVCFFSGGRPCGNGLHCGHAAVKVRSHAWRGAGLLRTPFLRNHRVAGRIPYRLQGCLVPPSTPIPSLPAPPTAPALPKPSICPEHYKLGADVVCFMSAAAY